MFIYLLIFTYIYNFIIYVHYIIIYTKCFGLTREQLQRQIVNVDSGRVVWILRGSSQAWKGEKTLFIARLLVCDAC